jgi:hypothetical protein
MQKERVLGAILLLLPLLVISGFISGNPFLWLITDVLIVLVAVAAGIYLIITKKKRAQ